MGYRGKVAEREEARVLRAECETLAEIWEMNQASSARMARRSDEASFAADVALYAGERSKTDGAVRFADSESTTRAPGPAAR